MVMNLLAPLKGKEFFNYQSLLSDSQGLCCACSFLSQGTEEVELWVLKIIQK
jgi:hypothetical protein